MTLPLGPGLWPAFWALGSNITSVGWPASGEIDFMENVPASSGLGPAVIRSTIHGGTSSNNYGPGQSYTFSNGTDVTSFHTYGAIWSPNMVQFYVDDPANIFFVQTTSDIPSGLSWDFNASFFLLLNLAVGGTGSWPGPPDNTTPNPALMAVDYVRAYTPSPVPGPAMTAVSMSVKAGQTGTSNLILNSTIGTGRVYLSCSTNAPKATCSLSSGDPLNQYTADFSSNASATATVSVTTTANTAVVSGIRGFSPGPWSALAGTFLLAVTLLPLTRPRRTLTSAGLLLLVLLLPACGGGTNSGGGGGGGGSNGTPPGSYTVTVNTYTVSNQTGAPDSTGSISLTVN